MREQNSYSPTAISKQGNGLNVASRPDMSRPLSKTVKGMTMFPCTPNCPDRLSKRTQHQDCQLQRKTDPLTKWPAHRNCKPPSFHYYQIRRHSSPGSEAEGHDKQTYKKRNLRARDTHSSKNIFQTIATIT